MGEGSLMTLLIKDAAKQLQIGPHKLFDLLHTKGFIAAGTNFPRDDMVKAGYFKTEPRSCTIKRPGESSGHEKLYYVTLVTDAGMKFLQPIVAEYKAAITPAPRRMRVTLELWSAEVVHALVRCVTLIEKLERGTISEEERAELHRARSRIVDDLPSHATASLERLNKKLFSHPKFQTVFQPQETRHAS
jgi:phage antirepressor YoqD-like protein